MGKRSPGGTRRTDRSKLQHSLRRPSGNVGNLRLKCACAVTPPRPRSPAPAPRCPRRARRRRDAPVTRPRSPRDRGRARRDRRARRPRPAAGSRPERAGAVDRQALPQRARRAILPRAHEHVPATGLPARESLGLARLLERIEARVRVGSDRDRAPLGPQSLRPARSRRRGSPPCSGRRTRSPALGHQVELGVVGSASRGRSSCGGRASPQASSSAIGRRPYSASDSAISRGCSSACTWSGRPCLGRSASRSPRASRAARRARSAVRSRP